MDKCCATSKGQVCHKHATSAQLKLIANAMRKDIITMISEAKSGHPGGSLSSADIMSVLFFSDVMEYNQQDALDHTNDRFFLSKGHAAPVLYAVYRQLGWIEEEDLHTLRQLNSKLQGHPDCHALPGIEVCSGSLGQGLSVAAGCALGMKLDAKKAGTQASDVYVLLGDGEMQEGSNWEAMMFAAHEKLDNLIAILDLNNLQIDGHVTDVCTLGDVDAKFAAFGWDVVHVNGHCVDALKDGFAEAKKKSHSEKPVVLICDTIKGKGVSFMEDQQGWHGKAPSAEQTQAAYEELERERTEFLQEVKND